MDYASDITYQESDYVSNCTTVIIIVMHIYCIQIHTKCTLLYGVACLLGFTQATFQSYRRHQLHYFESRTAQLNLVFELELRIGIAALKR